MEKTNPASDKLTQVEKLLDEYEIRKGVILVKPRNDIEEYLNMSRDDMRKLSAEDCGEAGT
jgi:diadenosine tetraphosphate (Ap4A) HIT family hydrolase